MGLFDAVQRQRDIVEDCRAVFAKVGKMGEGGAGIVVSTKTLESAPYSWQSCEKSKEARVPRVALRRVIPVIRIKAKEKFKILYVVSRPNIQNWGSFN